jgi:hypothetical protein
MNLQSAAPEGIPEDIQAQIEAEILRRLRAAGYRTVGDWLAYVQRTEVADNPDAQRIHARALLSLQALNPDTLVSADDDHALRLLFGVPQEPKVITKNTPPVMPPLPRRRPMKPLRPSRFR